MENILEIRNLKKEYKSKIENIVILDNINLDIEKGKLISVMGKSGSGKTSLLNILGRLDSEYEGNVNYTKDVKISFVFQFHHLLPEFNALENIMLPALAQNYKDKKAIQEKARKLLEYVGLEKRAYQMPANLSGGEKQRVAIARAMIDNPDIILADEPTGNLDYENSLNINELLKKLIKRIK